MIYLFFGAYGILEMKALRACQSASFLLEALSLWLKQILVAKDRESEKTFLKDLLQIMMLQFDVIFYFIHNL